jgi:hypothetical protein
MRTRLTRFKECCSLKGLVLLLVVLLFSGVASAQVPPASIFQLDGNAAATGATCNYATAGPCDTWDLLNGSGNSNVPLGGIGNGSSAGHSSVRTFLNGTLNTFNFTGGGSKDPGPISGWTYTSSNTPNKDTLNAGYAAAYTVGGDFELIFGADRLSPSGDANIGIWFFQNSVGPNGSGGFTGSHTDHDVFVISAFTGGGGTSIVSTYEWDHTCAKAVRNAGSGQCADANLRVLATPATSCGTSIYCGITNSASTSTTWEGSLASPLFFEGGVDLTAAFAAVGVTSLPCFSSFLVETRSSQSTTAVLKDFLSGGFPVCGLSVTKNCKSLTNAGPSVDPTGKFIDYPVSGTVKNTGVGILYNVSVNDVITYASNSSNDTGTPLTLAVTNNTAGSQYQNTNTLAANDTGTWSTLLTSSASSVQDHATASGTTDQAGTNSISSSPTDLITCSLQPTSVLVISKLCSPGTTLVAGTGTGADVHVNVAYSGSVCNTGPSAISGLAVADYTGTSLTSSTAPTLTSPTLDPCTSPINDTAGNPTGCSAPTTACTTYSGNYNPGTIDATSDHGRYFFNDRTTITTATAAVGSLTKISNSSDTFCNGTYGCSTVASCPICQSGQCVQ